MSLTKAKAGAVANGNHSLSGCGHGGATVYVSTAEQTGPSTGVSVRGGGRSVRGRECEGGGSGERSGRVGRGEVWGRGNGEGVGMCTHLKPIVYPSPLFFPPFLPPPIPSSPSLPPPSFLLPSLPTSQTGPNQVFHSSQPH